MRASPRAARRRGRSAEVKVLIAYQSRYGATEGCARRLAQLIGDGASLVNLSKERRPALDGFDIVLIGGPIYAGKLPRAVLAFCERERNRLLERRVGLFICCLYRDERAAAELRSAFPDWLATHAFAADWLGGELHPDRLSCVHRLLVRSIPGATGDISQIRDEAVRGLAEATKALLPRA